MRQGDWTSRVPSAHKRLALALALPLAGLASMWATTHAGATRGTEWVVPVTGSDPRDLLRGHYVMFELEWPGLVDDGAQVDRLRFPGADEGLCLEGRAPVVRRVTLLEDRRRAGGRCASVVRPIEQPDGGRSLSQSVFFTEQRSAARLGRAIQERGGQARIRVREDGLVTVLALEAAPAAAGPQAPASAPVGQ